MSMSISGTNRESKAKARKLRAADKRFVADVARLRKEGQPSKPPEPPKPPHRMSYDEQEALWKQGLEKLNAEWRARLEGILEGIARIQYSVDLATRNLSVEELGCDCVLEEHAILQLAGREIAEQWHALHVLLGGRP